VKRPRRRAATGPARRGEQQQQKQEIKHDEKVIAHRQADKHETK
jgi:hypothetical protein